MRNRTYLCWLILLAVVAMISAAEFPGPSKKGGSQMLTWVDQDGEERARAWYGFGFGEQVYASRLLLELPEGSRLVLSQQHEPLVGRERFVIRDVASGWWVELTEVSAFLQYDDVSEIGQPGVVAQRFMEGGATMTVNLKGVALEPFSMTWAVTDDLRDHDFFEQFRGEREVGDFVNGIPTTVRRSIRLLGWLGEGKTGAPAILAQRDLLMFLGAALNHSEPESRREVQEGKEWSLTVIGQWQGAPIRSPEAVSFATKFPVELEAPLPN